MCSQYFKAVSPERQEYLSLDGAMGAVERITNTRGMAKLAFALYDHDAPDDYYDYYGRWSGTDVRLVGDYDESGLYDECRATMHVAPLSNPHLIQHDPDTATAPDPKSVTDDVLIEIDHMRGSVIKGSWNAGRFDCSHPSKNHPDYGTDVGSYVPLRESDSELLDEDTYGVVMDIRNDWTNITAELEEEFQVLADEGELEQDGTAMLPKNVISADS